MILLDLGVSSPQIDKAERGFSFKADAPGYAHGPISTPNGRGCGQPHVPERSLSGLSGSTAKSRKARAVAGPLSRGRPFATTAKLAKVVRGAACSAETSTRPPGRSRPFGSRSTLSLSSCAKPCRCSTKLLRTGGRLAVISFHSLEDRIVKQFFDTESRDCICPPKQPVCTCDARGQPAQAYFQTDHG
jgi:16S rRNA (cytosine1402-N4)-methyltransferase